MSKKIVMVSFKANATESQVEEVLKQYPHEKVLDKKHDEANTDKGKVLARLYSFKVLEGSQTDLKNELYSKFSDILYDVSIPAERRLS